MEGKAHLEYLTLLAKEYKIFNNFHVQINCVAEGFDLLRRSKLPIHVPKEQTYEKNYLEANRKFSKALGSIQFLNHLKTQEKPNICRNCETPTENMVFM